MSWLRLALDQLEIDAVAEVRMSSAGRIRWFTDVGRLRLLAALWAAYRKGWQDATS